MILTLFVFLYQHKRIINVCFLQLRTSWKVALATQINIFIQNFINGIWILIRRNKVSSRSGTVPRTPGSLRYEVNSGPGRKWWVRICHTRIRRTHILSLGVFSVIFWQRVFSLYTYTNGHCLIKIVLIFLYNKEKKWINLSTRDFYLNNKPLPNKKVGNDMIIFNTFETFI